MKAKLYGINEKGEQEFIEEKNVCCFLEGKKWLKIACDKRMRQFNSGFTIRPLLDISTIIDD